MYEIKFIDRALTLSGRMLGKVGKQLALWQRANYFIILSRGLYTVWIMLNQNVTLAVHRRGWLSLKEEWARPRPSPINDGDYTAIIHKLEK